MATIAEFPATKGDLDQLEKALRSDVRMEMAQLEVRLTRWMVGTIGGMTVLGLGFLTLILKFVE